MNRQKMGVDNSGKMKNKWQVNTVYAGWEKCQN